MKKYQKAFQFLFVLSIGFTILHLVFFVISNTMAVDIQSLLLNVIPYGLPIFIFSSARRICEMDKPLWRKAGFVMMACFGLTCFAMFAHITCAFFLSKQAFINIYFNVPILYTVPLLLFAMFWGIMKRQRKTKDSKGTRVAKFFDKLPWVWLVTMLLHCGVISGVEIYRQINRPLSTSAPWWVMPLLIALCYIVAIGVSLIFRGIYHYLKDKK